MKSIVLKVSGWVLIIGLVFLGVRGWDNIKKWNLNTDPSNLSIAALTNNIQRNIYVSLSGGKLDISNAYEESLTTKSDAKLTSNFYIPVLTSESELAYVLKSSLMPTLADLSEQVNALGILLDESELSSEMRSEFAKKYDSADGFYVLDATYNSQTRLERAKGLIYPFIAVLIAFFVRFAVVRNINAAAKSKEQTAETES